MGDGNIEFWLKRPSDANRKDIKLSMSRSCTQADVKARVHVEYDDRPDAACITLIHGGRVLKDDTEKLQDIFKMVGADILPSLHVVVRNTAGSHAKPQLADAQADRSLSPSASRPQDQHRPSLSQPEMQQRAMQPALGSAAGLRSASEDRSAPSAIRGSPFAHANGAHIPAQPPAQAPLPPLPALIPLGSLGRALSGDVQLQTRGSGASSSGHAGAQNGLLAAQASPSAMPLPTAQLSLPRPQARPQHGPVNAGPTLNASPGSQSEASSGGVRSAMASNPAMALAFSAAFAALTSPSALASIGMQPPHVPLQPPSPSQAQSLLQEQLQQLLRQRDGMPQQPVMGQPYLQPVFPSPVTYMPMVGMVQAPPGSNEQNQQAHYATVLAPMVPMMMPYGMMPYPAAPMPGGQPAQPQAFAHLPPQAAGPAVQQAPRGNDAFPDEALHARPAGANPRFRGAGADAGARGRPAQVRVRMVQINLRALLQLGVMAIILYQHCPPGRFLLFATIGLALYVTGPAPLRRAWHRLLAMLPPMQGPQQHGRPQPDRDGPRPPNNRGQEVPAHQPPAPAGPAGGRPAEAAPAVHGVAAGLPGLGLARPRGLLQEVQALVVGFFTSLMPGWNINPEDAAAFAAAQQVVAANQAREAGNNQRRDHQD